MPESLNPSASPVVQLFGDSPSLLDFGGGQVIAATELANQADALARYLSSHPAQLEPGSRVALWMPNGADYIRTFLACAAAGYLAVSVNTKYSRSEVAALISRSGASLLITDQPDGASVAGNATVLLAADILVEPELVHHDTLAMSIDVSDRLADQLCVLFTTSGTTSLPKMVVHTQASIAGHAHDVAANGGLQPSDTALVVMPLCGTFGLASLTGVVAAGCSRVLVPASFDAKATSALILEQQVTVCNGSDDMYHRLLGTGVDLSSIRLGGYARFNTSLEGIVERADAGGVRLIGLYGMSEVQALFAIRDGDASTAERSLPGGTMMTSGAHARVIDGELQLRGPSMFAGYLAEGGDRIDTALTESAFVDGWFMTGDSAESDESDQAFTFIARIGDVLRIGGFLVAPAEIEHVITQLPSVEAAQVVEVGLAVGARPVAFVIVAAGHDAPSEQTIQAHCAEVLARFKIPVRVEFVDAFPTTDGPNGIKIRRSELREIAQAAVDG